MQMSTPTVALALGLAVVSWAPPARADTCRRLDARVADAKTPEDHDAIATCFDKRAARLREEKRAEQATADEYLGPAMLPLWEEADARGADLENQAKRYDEMAATHRDMARALEKDGAATDASATPGPSAGAPSAPPTTINPSAAPPAGEQ
jgi:hypothetical protein